MTRRIRRRSDCPISTALDLFGDRWTLLIIRDLMFKGKRAFSELIEAEERMATNILADRLALLEAEGVIRKEPDERDRRRSSYRLTAKGIDLLPILVEVVRWSAKYDARTAADRDFVARAESDRAGLLRAVRRSLERSG